MEGFFDQPLDDISSDETEQARSSMRFVSSWAIFCVFFKFGLAQADRISFFLCRFEGGEPAGLPRSSS
jgi:hypothetical protein